MQVEAELARSAPRGDALLTIGVFDGVHLGHQYLIGKLVTEAKQKALLSGVITFKEHPRDIFPPRKPILLLTTLEERQRLIAEQGVDFICTLSFTRELSGLTAREFVALLQNTLRMKGLVVGPDTTVGKGREGTVDVLRELGEEMGFSVTVVSQKKTGGEPVSSTAIRNALAEGDMRRVTRLLGRPFSLHGPVTTGVHRGTGLGFPTANIKVSTRQALPPDGVYATWAYLGGEKHQSMTNIGKRPTFGADSERTVEVFILDYTGDIYGKDLRVELMERLRGEKRFENADALKIQIAEDVKRGREILIQTH